MAYVEALTDQTNAFDVSFMEQVGAAGTILAGDRTLTDKWPACALIRAYASVCSDCAHLGKHQSDTKTQQDIEFIYQVPAIR